MCRTIWARHVAITFEPLRTGLNTQQETLIDVFKTVGHVVGLRLVWHRLFSYLLMIIRLLTFGHVPGWCLTERPGNLEATASVNLRVQHFVFTPLRPIHTRYLTKHPCASTPL